MNREEKQELINKVAFRLPLVVADRHNWEVYRQSRHEEHLKHDLQSLFFLVVDSTIIENIHIHIDIEYYDLQVTFEGSTAGIGVRGPYHFSRQTPCYSISKYLVDGGWQALSMELCIGVIGVALNLTHSIIRQRIYAKNKGEHVSEILELAKLEPVY